MWLVATAGAVRSTGEKGGALWSRRAGGGNVIGTTYFTLDVLGATLKKE